MGMVTPRAALALSAARSHGRFFAAAIFLCVTVLVGVTASAQFLRGAMEANARQLLAADLRLQAPLVIPSGGSSEPLPTELLTFAQQQLSGPGRRLSPGLEFSAMARAATGGRSALVEIKAVSADYPLRGRVELEQGGALSDHLIRGGIVVEKGLLNALGVAVGERILLGDASFTITGLLTYEPDRVTHLFALGPRILMPMARVAETGLLQVGSRVNQVVSVRLAEGEEAVAVARALRALPQAATIRVITPEQSQPSVRRFIRRFVLFLGLTSLLTLLVGGMAMSDALAAYLRESRQTLAILKLLGADNRQLARLLLWSILRMVWVPALAGGGLGILLPALLPHLLVGLFPAEAIYRPSPWLAVGGAGLGMLFSLLCAVGPLWWSRHLSPARLFHNTAWEERVTGGGWMGYWPLLGIACVAVGMAAWSGESRFGWVFAGGLGGMLLVAWGMARASLWWLPRLTPRRYEWRLAIHALLRRGGNYGAVLMALGVGLGLVSGVLFLEDSLNQQMVSRLPQRLPSFFFIDIQPDQRPLFQEVAQKFALPQADAVRLFPTIRGRLVSGTTPVEEDPDQPQSWRKAREYVLTQAAEIPTGNRLVAGSWWTDPTAMEASVEVEMANGLGLQVGDMLTFAIQGVHISARIVNLRAVRWSDLGLNFFVIFSPAVLQDLPVTYMASVVAPEAQEEPLLVAMSSRLPNVTAIATRMVLASVRELLQQLARSVRLLGGAAVLAGLLVLGVSVAASRRRRVHEIALYRLIGTTRGEAARIVAAEHAILGCVSAATGVAIGQLLTALAVRGLLNDLWIFNPWLTLAAFAGGAGVVFLTGWIGSYRELGEPVLRVLQGTTGR
ncbi:MAG: ABC transporter permease [Magnetococcus sp. XQGC-1]